MAEEQRRTIAKVNIVARRFDETLAFYRLIGLEIPEVRGQSSETRHAPANNGAASFAIDDAALARIYSAEWRQAPVKNSVLLTAQLPTRDAVDKTFAALVGAGHRPIQPPYDAFWGARYAIVADPEGNSVGLESPTDDSKRSWPPAESPDP
jgi:uncharacterized glyoxalase superfamily protein PhnB